MNTTRSAVRAPEINSLVEKYLCEDTVKMKFEWKLIHIDAYETECTHRAKVLGGWIVRHENPDGYMSIVFIPDQKHNWLIENQYE